MSLENFCDVLTLVRKGPRTIRELVQITGQDRTTLRDYLELLRQEGHIRVCETPPHFRKGRPAASYEWLEPIHGGRNG